MVEVALRQQGKMAKEEKSLKYLKFVQVAALHALICFLNLYGYAKEKSGPLKPGIKTVEGVVKTVYDKYQDVPTEVLKFMDRKIDESVVELDQRVPHVIKQLSTRAFSAAQQTPAAAQTVTSEVKRAGMMDAATGIVKSICTKFEPVAKELYSKLYEVKLKQYAISTWCKLNQLPVFPHVAQMVLPTTAYCLEKYNETVRSTAEKGYGVSAYLPLVPMEKITEALGEDTNEVVRVCQSFCAPRSCFSFVI